MNLCDVTLSKQSNKSETVAVVSVKRNILQRLITAYKAKRPVDLKQVASLGLMSVPIGIFLNKWKHQIRNKNINDIVI